MHLPENQTFVICPNLTTSNAARTLRQNDQQTKAAQTRCVLRSHVDKPIVFRHPTIDILFTGLWPKAPRYCCHSRLFTIIMIFPIRIDIRDHAIWQCYYHLAFVLSTLHVNRRALDARRPVTRLCFRVCTYRGGHALEKLLCVDNIATIVDGNVHDWKFPDFNIAGIDTNL